jgi:CelD/BcsL family acetyltransferase involved in cellulose biosynthesis
MCCERGLTTFALGIGEAHYKDSFCGDVEPLFDSFLPVTTLGSMGATVLRTAYAAKRQIKNSDKMWSAAQTVRRRLIAMRGKS